MSDEKIDYTPRPERGRKAKPRAEEREQAPRKPEGRAAADSTPRTARREQARAVDYTPRAARVTKRKKPARRGSGLKLSSILSNKTVMVIAVVIGLLVLVVLPVVAELLQVRSTGPAGSLVDQGNSYYDQGLKLLDSGDYEGAYTALQQAASYYEQALVQTPEDVQVRTDLGAVYFYESGLLSDTVLLQQAVETWKVALQYQPDKSEALFNLGLGYSQLGQVDLAIAAWQRVIEVAPGTEAAQAAQQYIQEYTAQPTVAP